MWFASWSSPEHWARQRIRPVDLAMAILAFPLNGPAADRRPARNGDGRAGQRVAAVVEVAGVAAGEVAALAQVGLFGLEQFVVVRAVGVVAGEAVFADGGMFV